MNVRMTANDVIEARVLEMLRAKIGPRHEVNLDSAVVEDTGLDSTSVLDFVMELEDEFDISIPLDQIAEVRTVGELAAVVRGLSRGYAGAHGEEMKEGH